MDKRRQRGNKGILVKSVMLILVKWEVKVVKHLNQRGKIPILSKHNNTAVAADPSRKAHWIFLPYCHGCIQLHPEQFAS
jgi:hypothetical protein